MRNSDIRTALEEVIAFGKAWCQRNREAARIALAIVGALAFAGFFVWLGIMSEMFDGANIVAMAVFCPIAAAAYALWYARTEKRGGDTTEGPLMAFARVFVEDDKAGDPTEEPFKTVFVPTKITRTDSGETIIEERTLDARGNTVQRIQRTSEGEILDAVTYEHDDWGCVKCEKRGDTIVKEFRVEEADGSEGAPTRITEWAHEASDIVLEGGTAVYDIEWNSYARIKSIVKRCYLPGETQDAFATMTVTFSPFGKVTEKRVEFNADELNGIEAQGMHSTFEYKGSESNGAEAFRLDEYGNSAKQTYTYNAKGKVEKVVEQGKRHVHDYDESGSLVGHEQEYESTTEYEYEIVERPSHRVMFERMVYHGFNGYGDSEFGLDF